MNTSYPSLTWQKQAKPFGAQGTEKLSDERNTRLALPRRRDVNPRQRQQNT
jgi:hypothetical protein